MQPVHSPTASTAFTLLRKRGFPKGDKDILPDDADKDIAPNEPPHKDVAGVMGGGDEDVTKEIVTESNSCVFVESSVVDQRAIVKIEFILPAGNTQRLATIPGCCSEVIVPVRLRSISLVHVVFVCWDYFIVSWDYLGVVDCPLACQWPAFRKGRTERNKLQ